jgi:diguanylate cyclase (GGDEF)-like protein
MSPLAVVPAAEKRPAVVQALAKTLRMAGRGGRRGRWAGWKSRLGLRLWGRPRASAVSDRRVPWRSGIAVLPRMPLLPALGLLLALGFGSSALISYLAARASNESQIAGTTLPLSAETIDAELESQLFQKVAVARAMAANTFLEQWLEAGEQDPAQVIAYLKGVRREIGATTAFLVSESSGRYYHPDGVLKRVSRSDLRDAWYFRFREHPAPFEINIDRDTADRSRVTAFINQKIRGPQGQLLGVIGIGVEVNTLTSLLRHMEERYSSEVLFSDSQGRILLSSAGNAISGPKVLADLPGLRPHVDRILSRANTAFQYANGGGQIFINSRRLPELDWWLLVLQRSGPNQGGILTTLFNNLLIALLITLVVLWLANLTIGDYQRRLEQLATTDRLTGRLNRTAFDPLFAGLTQAALRRGESLSALLVDIDHFKAINDSQGHPVGDRAIQLVCERMAARIRHSDQLFRWGGEEFLLLLPACEPEAAERMAWDLCRAMRAQPLCDDQLHIPITVSIGLTGWQPGEDQHALLARADRALYQAKQAGRDRVVRA